MRGRPHNSRSRARDHTLPFASAPLRLVCTMHASPSHRCSADFALLPPPVTTLPLNTFRLGEARGSGSSKGAAGG